MIAVEEERGCGSMLDFGGEIRSDLSPAKHFCVHAMAPTTYDNMASQSGISKNVNEQSSWKIFQSAFAKVSQTGFGSRVAPLKPCSDRDMTAPHRTTRCMSTTGAGVVRRCATALLPPIICLFRRRAACSRCHPSSLAAGILAAIGGIGYFMSLAEAKMKEEAARKKHDAASNSPPPPFVPMHR